ncbi:hypothetical protein B0H16DRAFT_1473066 [Mycena metata]|uniref:Uncharacterized protein n=1 Tax=Mycena metata TaxID=1033252 RepID=A0AAD7HL28_9AGAR|nr:hypothetical protein B0H16DRAFT_1473066 [Mycena metata]
MFAVLAAFPTVSISLSFLTFQSPRDFERIVRCFGSGVQTLALQRICILRGAPHQTSPLPIVRPQITRLKLISCAAAVSEKLGASSCPLDLQNLVDVTFTSPMSPAFIELLKSSQSTITSHSDLAFPLPALTHLSFDAVWMLALAVVVQSLSHSPGLPSLREISLTVTDLDAPLLPQHADWHLRNFDRAVNALQLPALQRVLFSLVDTTGRALKDEFLNPSGASKQELVEGCLPMLHARGVLVVKSC